MSTLQHLDALQIGTNLHDIPDRELLLRRLVSALESRRRRQLSQHGRIERPPMAAAVRHHDVVVLIDAHDLPGPAQTLEHPIRPSAMSVLQRLHDLQVEIHVHLVPDLDAGRSGPARSLLAQAGQVVAIDRLSLGVVDDLQVGHALESDAIEILGAVVPDDVGRGPGTGRRPVLRLLHLAAAAVAAVLVLPLPVDAADDAGAGEDAPDGDLLALAPGLEEDALAARRGDAVEAVPELVLVAVVADRA